MHTANEELCINIIYFSGGDTICRLCYVGLEGPAQLRTHLVMSHDKEGDFWNSSSASAEANYKQCPLCPRWIVQSRSMIRNHLKRAHGGMPLERYFLENVFNRKGEKIGRGQKITFGPNGVVLHQAKKTACRLILDKRSLDRLAIARYRQSNQRSRRPVKDEEASKLQELRRSRGRAGSRSLHFRRIFKTAPVSKVIKNACVFRCPRCCKEFSSRFMTERHLKRERDRFPSGEKMSPFDCLKTIVSHKCEICQRLVLCDKSTIAAHLRRIHGQKMEMYLKTYRLILASETPVVNDEEAGVRAKVPMVPASLFITIKVHPRAIKKEDTTFTVSNLCKFRCLKCSYVTRSYSGLIQHKLKCCRESAYRYSVKEVVEARAHMCCVCSRRILCDKDAIRRHATEHKIHSIAEYLKLAHAKMKEAKAAINSEQGQFESFGKEKAWEENTRMRKLVPKVLHALEGFPSKVPKELTTTLVANLCTFRCKVCLSYQTENFEWFTLHRRKCWPPSQKRGMRCHPDDVVEARQVQLVSLKSY